MCEILFYFFALTTTISSIFVISNTNNPVHSVLFLILTFVNCTALFILLGVEFFGVIFLIVYVGAIAILFLFVVMMINIRLVEISTENLTRYLPIGLMLSIIFFLQLGTQKGVYSGIFSSKEKVVATNTAPQEISGREISPALPAGEENQLLGGPCFLQPLGDNNKTGHQQFLGAQEPLRTGGAPLELKDSLLSLRGTKQFNVLEDWATIKPQTNLENIGSYLYSEYFVGEFFIIAIILMVSMVGCILLTTTFNEP